MLMNTLREKTRVVLFLALVAFLGLIFFDWGMQSTRGGGPGGGGAIGKVNGQDIPFDSYRATRQNTVREFEQGTGRSPDDADLERIESQTWLTLIQETLLVQSVKKYGIGASDAEVLEVLRSNPPAILRSQFVNEEGQFDAVAYQRAMADPSIDWSGVEQYIRSTMPMDKLVAYVGMNARVTSAEVRSQFDRQHETARVKHVTSLISAVELEEADETPPETALTAYYESHREDFQIGEQAVLEVIQFPKTPSPADSEEVRQDLLDLREMALEGTDFADLATEWSEEPASAERGGDLGFFGVGEMPPALESAAMGLDPGEISEVVRTDFGLHIVKVEEKKTEEDRDLVRARHILMRVEPSRKTIMKAAARSDDFAAALAEGGDFAKTADEFGIELVRTDPFTRSERVPGIGYLRGVRNLAFREDPGATSPDPEENDQGFFLYRLVERIPAHAQPMDEVLDTVRAYVVRELRATRAQEALEAAVAASDGSLEGIARELGTEIKTPKEFTRDSFVPGVGVRNDFSAAAFSMDPGSVSEVLETDRGFHVLMVEERIPGEEALFVEKQAEIRNRLIGDKRQRLLAGWLEQLLVNAEIEDFRTRSETLWTPDDAVLSYLREN
ncbi:MAG: peptidyl-prolyl cis-trans isomerase [Gemmatimonadota bacterium]|jgi:peptidyl-prolyl cis-trans isomerase D|nr:peptidyl-prolyl cis-trans isomerase [Gemmatimonadota bacterium]MDP6529846.1 peptidyl-prolyl cis-trans isomerase [Gemmatimonadota bacterium]MDP6802789.1 peptidyl-prolyl cis-trans isomerase [Gemmatimonadota bacterium]MDP7032730.1 peptidyl-prolyl cis-trans isomerase [Gemmatimonadota bacterium]